MRARLRPAVPVLALALLAAAEAGAVLEREVKRVPRGRAVVLPFTERTRGHGSHTMAALWKDQLAAFLEETER